jgi:hypothetical protein
MVPTAPAKETAIVYGVYINPDANWRRLIWAQLKGLRKSGVLSVADLHVIVTNPAGANDVSAYFDNLPLSIKYIEHNAENKFEYPAISHVWNLASNRAEEYKYIGYLHTKGMSYAQGRRDKLEKVLTHFTFAPWSKTFRVFETYPRINKIGLFPAGVSGKPAGFIWFNFWWARSDYIRTLPKPAEDPNRYYYERWLGLGPQSRDAPDCHSILTNDTSIFSGLEAGNHFSGLRWQMQYGPFAKVRKLLHPLHNLRRKISRALHAHRL